MAFLQFDDSEPLITPASALAYYRSLAADPEADLALPNLLVGTFQNTAFEHLAGRLGDSDPVRWPTPVFYPMARGTIGERTLAVARLPVGASHAAMALELMIAAGVRTILLVGSAGSLQSHLPLGALVIPTTAIRHEGTSHHYLAEGEAAVPAPELVDDLVSAAVSRGLPAPALGPAWSTDAPYRECASTVARLQREGALVVEMEAAALFAVGLHRRVRVATIVAISDQLRQPWTPGFHTLAYRRGLMMAADVALDAALHAR